jgi:hypothetical protein
MFVSRCLWLEICAYDRQAETVVPALTGSRHVLVIEVSTQSGVDHASIGLRPDLVLTQMGRQLSEIERSIDFLIFHVAFKLGKLLSKRPAVSMKFH